MTPRTTPPLTPHNPFRTLLCAAVLLGVMSGAFAAPTGHQLFVGPAFQGPVPAQVSFAPGTIPASGSLLFVTIYLHRADDAGPDHPPAISFDLVWDPAVLASLGPPNGVQASSLIRDWYDKQLTVNYAQAASGRLSISVSGGVTFDPDTFDAFSTEITTFDNQLPVLDTETGATQQNPFPLMTVAFDISGGNGAATPLAFEGAVLSDQEGFALPNQGAIGTTVVVDSSYPAAPPGTPAAGLTGAALLAGFLLLAGTRRTAASRK